MWRGLSILTLLVLIGGCASQRKPAQTAADPLLVARSYEPGSAGALVFDPPVISGQPPLQLARDLRTPEAFVGYETTATYFYLRIDDRDASDYSSRYERRAISHKIGVSYR